jgi:hypothetical protein
MPMRGRHRASAEARYSGIAAELGVYDDVFLCLSPGEPLLEHGIVEHRYKELCPTAYSADSTRIVAAGDLGHAGLLS